MTLSSQNRRDRAAQGPELKAARSERRQATTRKHPWVLPVIVTVAVLILIGIVIEAAALGKLF
ncbi:MAG: hypothetical protein ABJA11_09645 [Pseudolysinimonas sp.]